MTAESEQVERRLQALTPDQRQLVEQRLEQRRRETAPDRIPARPDRTTAPQTLDQQFLWFVSELAPESSAYNINFIRHLSGALDRSALVWSIGEIVRRHESLRTTFALKGAEPIQVIHEPSDPPVVVSFEDFSDLPETERESRLDARVGELANAPLDLEHGPLVRAHLLKGGHQEHVLLVTIHHIVTDRVSYGVFERELSALYTASLRDAPPPLPELPIQYGDFAAWQRGHLQGARMEKLAAFWERQLEGAPLTLELPTDRARPPVQSFRGRRHTFALDSDLREGLKAVAEGNGVTAFVLHMAAFGVLLSRYAQQKTILIGSPIANRERPETQGLIGYLLNVLPIRVDLDGDPRFDELLARVQQVAVGAFAHHEMPFGAVIERLNPPRDLSRNPVIQTSLIYVEARERGLELPGVRVRPWSTEHRGSRFDLSLALIGSPSSLEAFFEYSTDLFDRSTVERMAEHYVNLLKAVVADPKQPISRLRLLGQAKRRQLLVDWNATASDYPLDATIPRLLDAQVARTPDAIAVTFESRSLTYAELNAHANWHAQLLRRHGVGPEVPVGIFVDRGVEMLVAMLGVLKAGGAYVPLDPAQPKGRTALLLDSAGVQVLLTRPWLRARLPEGAGSVLYLGGDADLAAEPASAPDVGAVPESLAYTIFTSGSTGRPKGVQVSHRNLVALLHAMRAKPGLVAGDSILAVTTISFDIAALELYLPLCIGARVVIAPTEVTMDGVAIQQALSREGITLMQATPATWQMLVHLNWPGDPKLKMLCGGEALPRALADALLERGGELWNMYGPTETTVWSAVGRVSQGQESITIGRPVANTAAYLLDDAMNPVPIGVPGELHVGGHGVARGYLNDAALTAARFVPDPFGRPGSRIYRTGDRARFRANGEIEFLGRIDRQLKVRGFRIEPKEIETALVEHPAVQDAVVIARGDHQGQKHLVAYVTSRMGHGVSRSELRRRLRTTLPDYMIPAAIVHLESLPLTPNGKVDHEALPPPKGDRQVEEAYVAPRRGGEARIAAIWRDVLGVEKVGVHDNFFDLGGHSLHLMQVRSRLREELGCDLSMTQLFQQPTVGRLTAHVDGTASPERSVTRSARARVARRGATRDGAIAVIGMAGRFPGADSIERFWTNVQAGVESIRFFTDDQLRAAGVDEATLRDPSYVKARGALEGVELFDARHFGYTPREAELIDPQQRIFLECAWHALEHAGCDPDRFDGLIGVYAGASSNAYLANLQSHPELLAGAGLTAMLSSDKDFLPTRISYKLNLRGPSMNVQTACSTSLVAVHEACRALLDQQCDVALAGGVSVSVPAVGGYTHREGDIASPDGHCRTFDARAEGTLRGNGAGVVVLKRLDEAIRDGDEVHAVILGSAVNNDGSNKVGYTAPSIDGQSEVVAMAQAAAGVDPDTITYIETHGTATPLGDPIEVAALTRVFREHTDRTGFCGLSALKPNIGHLDAAAGVAGLIKTVLALEHRTLPPTLHFERPNPEIDFERSPFYVITDRRDWDAAEGAPRRAGVSAFGLGGTNAHAVLEEAPVRAPSDPCEGWQLLVLSAKDAGTLDTMANELAAHLDANRSVNLADVAYTLQVGRRELEHRRAVRCRDIAEAIAAISGDRPDLVDDGHATVAACPDAALEAAELAGLEVGRGAVTSAHVSELGRRWVQGAAVDWSRLHGDARRQRVSLPTYPFRRERYWIERRRCVATGASAAGPPARRADLAEWFYAPFWHRCRPARRSASTSPILVFARDAELDRQIVARLEASGRAVCVVRAGGSFRATGGSYDIDPRSPDHYARLLDELRGGPGIPDEIVHLWTLSFETHRLSAKEAETLDQLGLRALLHVARALESLDGAGALRIDVVTDGAQDVTGRDPVQPEKSTVLGFCRTLPLEVPGLSCRTIDLPTSNGPARSVELADQIAQECLACGDETMVAFRDGGRLVQSFARVELDRVEAEPPGRLRDRGVYLVTGGLGGMGLELAGELARAVQARLILTGRTGAPVRDRSAANDDATHQRARAIEAMEAAGAEVMVGAVDVTDLDRMRAIVKAARDRFGRIDGVLHMAGVPGAGAIGRAGVDDLDRTFAPKVHGARVLAKIFGEEPLDFMVLASSLITAWGLPGRVDYCAANAYLDAFARRFRADTGTPTVAIGWTRWRDTGMGVALAPSTGRAITARGISTQEGIEAFRRIIDRYDEPHVLVSEVDFRDATSSQRRQALVDAPAGGSVEVVAPERHARPELSTGYEAPRTDAERDLAAIWQDLLGIERIGVHDNFFEIGGDSVLGIQVVWRAREAGLALGPNSLFEHQTIGELAAATMTQAKGETSGAPAVAEETIARAAATSSRYTATSLSDDDLARIVARVHDQPARPTEEEGGDAVG